MSQSISFSYGNHVSSVQSASGNSVEDDKWKRLSEGGSDFGSYLGSSSHAGKAVSQRSAMQLSAFWACVRVTAQAVAGMPLDTYEKKRDDSRVKIDDHDIGQLLKGSPNQDQTPSEFWESNVAWMMTQGNAYCEKRFIGNRLAALEPISQLGVVPKRNQDGVLQYHFNDRGKTEVLPRNRVFHLKGFGLGGDLGLSVIRHGVQTFGTAMATDETAGKIFGNGMHASGVLSSEQSLKDTQRDQLGKIMQKFVGSSNAGKMMILEAGLKYDQITMNPEDAQMLETRKFNIEEICRWSGTPPIVIGHSPEGQTMWGSGVESIMLAWLVLGINPLLIKIEQRIKKQLLGGLSKVYSEYNREALLQMDSTSKQRFLSSMVQNGLYTRNEARQKLNMPRVDGADDLTVQTALAPLDQLAEAISSRSST